MAGEPAGVVGVEAWVPRQSDAPNLDVARPLVVLESPYAGDTRRNEAYLRACLRDSLERGEAPYASHRMYTDALDDDDPAERKLGIEAGFAWGQVAALRAFYVDLGWSRGMRFGELAAAEIDQPTEIRRLPLDVLAEILSPPEFQALRTQRIRAGVG